MLAGGNSLAVEPTRALLERRGLAAPGPIDLPSLHLVGRRDATRPLGAELARAFRDPQIVYHSGGHELPLTLRRDAAFQTAVHAFFDGVAATPVPSEAPPP